MVYGFTAIIATSITAASLAFNARGKWMRSARRICFLAEIFFLAERFFLKRLFARGFLFKRALGE